MQHILLEPGKVCLSNSFILSFQVLCWSYFGRFLVFMGGKAEGENFFLTKTIGFDSRLFNCMLLSA